MPQFFSEFFIKINGRDVSQEFMDAVLEVVVDSSLYLPEMFSILLQDTDLKWTDDTKLLDLGKEVEISAEASEQFGGAAGKLMKGEITALEPRFSAEGRTMLVVRGYNKSHRLHRGRQIRTFLKQTDSDVVQRIAGEVGLSAEVDRTSITYDYLLQNNQTNMEFLQARAARLGYQVFAAEGKLYFKKGEANLGDGPELNYGENLRTFQPSLTSTHQADKVIVRGWDPKQKKSIKGQATPNAAMKQGGISKTGGAAAKSAFGANEVVVTNRPVVSVAEANALATGLINDLSGQFIEAEGVCYGDPGIKAGKRITIKGVGTRFSGKYFVTSALHIWNEDGYETQFNISGRLPNTVSQLINSEQHGNGAAQGLIQGVVIGQVTNLNDPEKLGRIKVKYPWLGDDIESDWMRVSGPDGGPDRGIIYLPEVNDEVLVAFEHGDVHHPFVVGRLWNNKDKPPKNTELVDSSGKVNKRVIKSRSGHVIVLDDTQGQEQIIIQDKKGGTNEIVISSKDDKMTIKVGKDFIVEAGGKVEITSKGTMTLDSGSQQMSLKCGKLDIQAQQTGVIKAMQSLTLEGTASLTAKGGGSATVQNNAGAKVALSGPMVNIN